jgi:hypothetical protein
MDPIIERKRLGWLPGWRRIRRIQIEVAILAVLLAMGVEVLRLGSIRDALISHHNGAADDLDRLASKYDGSAEASPAEPVALPSSPAPDVWKMRLSDRQRRAQTYRRLARWYRWQSWRYRLPLFTSVAKYQGLSEEEIDTREWIKKLGYLERIEQELRSQEGPSNPERDCR